MLTSLFRADGKLLARFAAANLVEGVHADAVHRCRVQVHDVGLVDGGGDVACGLLKIPGIWKGDSHFKARLYIFWDLCLSQFQLGCQRGPVHINSREKSLNNFTGTIKGSFEEVPAWEKPGFPLS